MRFVINRLALTKIQAILCVIVLASSIVLVAYSLNALSAEPALFSLTIKSRPASFGEALYAIPNQKFLLLVTIGEENQSNIEAKTVAITAASLGCEVTVYPQAISPGQVGEVTVIPNEGQVGKNVTVTIRGERGGISQTETVTFEVIEEEDREATLGPEAILMRDKFVQWFALEHQEFAITSETVWTGTVVNPRVLVVMHYMFLSEDWEMYVTWHVMIPPYDWSRVYLRPRYNATAPAYAFEISSIQGQAEPQAIEIPDWV
jgi:hypothetical protein